MVIENLDLLLFHGNQATEHWTRGALQDWQGDTKHLIMDLDSHHLCPSEEKTTLLSVKQGNSPLSRHSNCFIYTRG